MQHNTSSSLYDDLDGGLGGGDAAAPGAGEGDLYGDLVEAAAAEESREDPQDVLRCVCVHGWCWAGLCVLRRCTGVSCWRSGGLERWDGSSTTRYSNPSNINPTFLLQPDRGPGPPRPPAHAACPRAQRPRKGRGPVLRCVRPGSNAPVRVNQSRSGVWWSEH